MGYLLVKSVLLLLAIAAANTLNDKLTQDELYRILNGGIPREPISYQVSLQIKIRGSDKYGHLCSGVILSPDFILTAASCIDRQNSSLLSVHAGVTDLLSTLGSRHSIQGYQVHDDYLSSGVNNIAIAKVTPPMVLNGKELTSIGYANTTEVGSGVHVHLSGWGTIFSFMSIFPRNLQMISATTITNARCQQTQPQITAAEICTLRSFLRGVCTGDEGGPVTNTNGTLLIGIISMPARPCGIGSPDVHTRVSAFQEWITGKMAETWT